MSEKLEEQQMSSGSSKSSDNEERDKKIAEIDKLLAEGKKLELVQLYEEAVDKFELATNTATEFFGDFAPECYLPALNYGKMLTQIARIESVNKPFTEKLGAGNENNENETENEDEDKIATENEGSQDDGKGEENQLSEKKVEGGNDEEENGEGNETKQTENGNEENAEEENEDTEDEENELAWDWLEVARQICEKQEQTHFWLERKSDAFFALGEFLTVAEEFEQAISEFEKALHVRQEIYKPSDRRIAEVLYMMGLTYANNDDFIKSSEYFERAKNVLENTIEDREKDLSEEETKHNQELVSKLKGEIEELQGLVLAIKEKMTDSTESAKSRACQLADAVNMIGKKLNSSNIEQQNQEVNDVTALLQHKAPKKRAAENGKENDETKTKLAKIDED
ncbi:unnamed protein product [Meloidogyne enterolobii]|uniref:Uncharacterized protein n=1 Tax=Meloidogyne enterolobii TaxID=390850 RepID=A0ACB0ZIY3_MELEN